MTIGEIVSIISTSILFITSIVIPVCVHLYHKRKEYKERNESIDKMSESIDSMHDSIQDLRNETKVIIKKQDLMEQHLDTFETQNLKYMINDAFFGYDDVSEIPYEILLSAAQNCDLYIGKKLNHEIGARCNIIYQELERRQQETAGGHKHD